MAGNQYSEVFREGKSLLIEMKQKFVSYTETKFSVLEVIVSLFSLKLTIVPPPQKKVANYLEQRCQIL